MIAITFALPTESSRFVSRLTNKRRGTLGAGEIIYGQIAQRSIVVLHTGVGRKTCEIRIKDFFREVQPAMVISAGFAGGVNEDYEVSDLFLAENFSDPCLMSLAQRAVSDQCLRVGKLFTAGSIVDSAKERNEIARAHAANAVDMETEVIARACTAHAIPMLALRALSDTAREPFPAPPSVLFDLERQKTNFGRLAAHFIARPAAIGRMFRFARQIKRARENLTTALTILLQADSLGPDT
jgi:nucleoside phosphorylase